MKKFDHKTTQLYPLALSRIDNMARLNVFAQFGIANGIVPRESIERFVKSNGNVNLHSAALCLYANLVVTRILDEQTADLLPEYVGDLDEARLVLKRKAEYASMTDAELDAEIEKICLNDVRNGFAHGKFFVACPNSDAQNGLFVLQTERSKINCPHSLVVRFDAAFDAVGKYIGEQTTKFDDIGSFLAGAFADKDKYLDEFILPCSLQAMVDHCFNPKEPLSMRLSFSTPTLQLHIQNALSCAMFAIMQNDYYKIFGPDSDIFKLASVFRNSWVHRYTKTTNNTHDQIVDDPKNSELDQQIVDDKLGMSETMEMLHVMELIVSSEIEAGNITIDQVRAMDAFECNKYAFGLLGFELEDPRKIDTETK